MVSMGGAVGKLLSKSCSGGLNAEFRNGIPARFGPSDASHQVINLKMIKFCKALSTLEFI